MDYELIFLAAGQGKRMQASQNKMWLELFAEPIFIRALRPFLADKRCTSMVIVTAKTEQAKTKELLRQIDFGGRKVVVVCGGSERQYSVANGLSCVNDESVVLVHDGARPFVTLSLIDRLLEGVKKSKAAICAVKVKDTIKQSSAGFVAETLPRDDLWQIQTPQAFTANLLKMAHQKAKEDCFFGTDESSLVERISKPIQIVEGSYTNIKLTTPVDLVFAKAIIAELGGGDLI